MSIDDSIIDHIVTHIQEQAGLVNNPDPVSRLTVVYMEVCKKLGRIMNAIREEERRVKP